MRHPRLSKERVPSHGMTDSEMAIPLYMSKTKVIKNATLRRELRRAGNDNTATNDFPSCTIHCQCRNRCQIITTTMSILNHSCTGIPLNEGTSPPKTPQTRRHPTQHQRPVAACYCSYTQTLQQCKITSTISRMTQGDSQG